MPVTDAAAKARALYDARRTRVPIPPFTDADPSLGMADGYAVQQELVPLILADGDRIVGHKVGVTSKRMQRMIGIDSPDHGPVLASTMFRDGDEIPLSRFIQPRIEAEVLFVLGERLEGPGVSVQDARRAIAGAVAGAARRRPDERGRRVPRRVRPAGAGHDPRQRGRGRLMADLHELARRLTEATADRTAIDQLTDDVPDLDVPTGYAVQRLLREQAGALAGWSSG